MWITCYQQPLLDIYIYISQSQSLNINPWWPSWWSTGSRCHWSALGSPAAAMACARGGACGVAAAGRSTSRRPGRCGDAPPYPRPWRVSWGKLDGRRSLEHTDKSQKRGNINEKYGNINGTFGKNGKCIPLHIYPPDPRQPFCKGPRS